MRLVATQIPGVHVIELASHADARGHFVRVLDREQFRDWGLPAEFDHISASHNVRARTLRGMHVQSEPMGEHKIVWCSQGSVFDVVLDLRTDSATFAEHVAFELDADKPLALSIAPGCAHGFLSLQAESTLMYAIAGQYSVEHAIGVRWDDPRFAIEWPATPDVLSERDATYPDHDPRNHWST